MLDFFSTISGYFVTAWNMIVNLVESLLMAVNMVVYSTGFVVAMTYYVPPIIATGLIIFIAVFVVRFLLLK